MQVLDVVTQVIQGYVHNVQVCVEESSNKPPLQVQNVAVAVLLFLQVKQEVPLLQESHE